MFSQETLLAYPDFFKPFDVYTDARHSQLGAAICQNDKPIAFYSCKLNPAQTRYTTTERELLAIVETLKEFRNILLGHTIRIFTDHQNLTYKNFNTERVMRWRLLIEEFGPELIYIKGTSNVVADALSRLNITSEPMSRDQTVVADLYGATTKDIMFPITFSNILSHQQRDTTLRQTARSDPKYHFKSFRGGGKPFSLICHNNKIVVPMSLHNLV